jgi:hypothetical protein
MTVDIKDFTWKNTPDSYSIYYKGKFLHGAAVRLPRQHYRHWRHKKADLENHRRIIALTIEKYMSGVYPLPEASEDRPNARIILHPEPEPGSKHQTV